MVGCNINFLAICRKGDICDPGGAVRPTPGRTQIVLKGEDLAARVEFVQFQPVFIASMGASRIHQGDVGLLGRDDHGARAGIKTFRAAGLFVARQPFLHREREMVAPPLDDEFVRFGLVSRSRVPIV